MLFGFMSRSHSRRYSQAHGPLPPHSERGSRLAGDAIDAHSHPLLSSTRLSAPISRKSYSKSKKSVNNIAAPTAACYLLNAAVFENFHVFRTKNEVWLSV